MFIEYSKLVYFTDTDILESLATVGKPYKIGVKCTKQHDLGFILYTLLYFINGHIRIRLQNSSYFWRG